MGPLFLTGVIQDMSDDGNAGVDDGRNWFVAPFPGKVKRVLVKSSAIPGAAQEITLRTDQGAMVLGSIPISSPVATIIEFEVDQHDPVNFIGASHGFAIESDGGGVVASIGGLIVEFGTG
jgi:hypothetical protein